MADDKDIEGEEGEGGGGGKKKLIIIIAAAVLLIGGGLAAFFLMGGEDEEAEEGAEPEAAEEEAVPEAMEGEPLYVKLDPQFVVNLPEGGPAKMLQVGVTVFTRHIEVSDFLTKNDPLIRHHMIDLLEQESAAELLTLEGKQALQTKILDLLSQKMLELRAPGEIQGVYFTEFVLQ